MHIDMVLRSEIHSDVKHVFFGGGFPGNDLTRYVLTTEVTLRVAIRQLMGDVSIFMGLCTLISTGLNIIKNVHTKSAQKYVRYLYYT